MAAARPVRVDLRFRFAGDLEKDLNRLAGIISRKYNRDIQIILRERWPR